MINKKELKEVEDFIEKIKPDWDRLLNSIAIHIPKNDLGSFNGFDKEGQPTFTKEDLVRQFIFVYLGTIFTTKILERLDNMITKIEIKEGLNKLIK